jgi:hypothetical protein
MPGRWADAARGLSADWPEAELMLQRIWRQESAGVAWHDARGAVYTGWLEGKAAMLVDRR